jgi:hypothetical protein
MSHFGFFTLQWEMSDRLSALCSKLPSDPLSKIQLYDSNPVADLIRAIEFKPLTGSELSASGLQLKHYKVWLPLCYELRRRLRHNRTRTVHGGCWLPILFDVNTWIMSFDRYHFETLEGCNYLPRWVKQEYLGVRSEADLFSSGKSKPCRRSRCQVSN